MRTALARFRDLYASHPLHLLLVLTSFAVLGYIVATFVAKAIAALAEKLGLQTAADQSGLADSMHRMGIQRNVPAIIGTIAGILAVYGVIFWDKLKLDDPVGALTVHLIGGTFGTICVGLFASGEVIAAYGMDAYCKPGLFYGGGAEQFIDQLIGVLACGGYVLVVAAVAWLALKATIGIRVSPEEEREGLDLGEHGNQAYYGFAFND